MDEHTHTDRRRFLQAGGLLGATALAGCSNILGGDQQETGISIEDFQGSGPLASGRPAPQGTSMSDLNDLEGTLTIYIGGGEGGHYRNLIELLEKKYPNFDARVRSAPSTQQANTIVEEMESGDSPADVFWSIDAGSLGIVADAGYAASLPDEVLKPVRDELRDSEGRWVGVAGRARSIPFNTDKFSKGDLPNSIHDYATDPRFQDALGWAPAYGAFKSFVAAMILLSGKKKTRQWLKGMKEQNVTQYPNEYLVSNATAAGEIGAGFANHYYALRVQEGRPDAPLDLAFTKGDAGALINVSGTEVIKGTQVKDLAVDFIHHLLTAEAQEFFATRTFAYPVISGVKPVAGLPTIDELEPPELDLTKLSNLDPALDLMREVGVL